MDQIFWQLKRFYPGSSEFNLDNFYSLPYEYVVIAFRRAGEARRIELHDQERPSALLASLYINSKIDTKKSSRYHLDDFCLYKPQKREGMASSRYSDAYKALIEAGRLPSWALFCYKDLISTAIGAPPRLLAFISEEAILLAPERVEDGYRGLLIAREGATGHREFKSPCGAIVSLIVPTIPMKVIAKEDQVLKLIR
jgi:hypothetical protein